MRAGNYGQLGREVRIVARWSESSKGLSIRWVLLHEASRSRYYSLGETTDRTALILYLAEVEEALPRRERYVFHG